MENRVTLSNKHYQAIMHNCFYKTLKKTSLRGRASLRLIKEEELQRA